MAENRRDFLKASLAATVGLGALASVKTAQAAEAGSSLIKPGQVILFQGDSITDTGRSRPTADTPNIKSTLGNGYAWLAASQILVDHPGADLKIFNRGISGNKVHQLAARWDEDCLKLKPDVLSILIGVNDVWHKLNGKYDGDLNRYITDYRNLLKQTKDALPEVKLVICEPFVLKCGAVDDKWFPTFDEFRVAAKSIADEFKAAFVPFQSAFDRAVEYAAPDVWAKDGVHPSGDCAALMAHEWLKVVYGTKA